MSTRLLYRTRLNTNNLIDQIVENSAGCLVFPYFFNKTIYGLFRRSQTQFASERTLPRLNFLEFCGEVKLKLTLRFRFKESLARTLDGHSAGAVEHLNGGRGRCALDVFGIEARRLDHLTTLICALLNSHIHFVVKRTGFHFTDC